MKDVWVEIPSDCPPINVYFSELDPSCSLLSRIIDCPIVKLLKECSQLVNDVACRKISALYLTTYLAYIFFCHFKTIRLESRYPSTLLSMSFLTRTAFRSRASPLRLTPISTRPFHITCARAVLSESDHGGRSS